MLASVFTLEGLPVGNRIVICMTERSKNWMVGERGPDSNISDSVPLTGCEKALVIFK